jgi:hypothetical protein
MIMLYSINREDHRAQGMQEILYVWRMIPSIVPRLHLYSVGKSPVFGRFPLPGMVRYNTRACGQPSLAHYEALCHAHLPSRYTANSVWGSGAALLPRSNQASVSPVKS